MANKEKEGVCPFCSGDNLDCYNQYEDEDKISRDFKCLNCGKRFSEYYKLVYYGYSYDDVDEGSYNLNGDNGEVQ